jgi:NADPH:quinone reductase-like Zn-dependent oxidoreductase
VVDSAGGDALNDALDSLVPGGSLVLYGATAGLPSTLNLRRIFWNQLRIQGSTMGSDADFAAMLDLVNAHQLVPIVDSVRPFAEALDAFAAMSAGQQFGKLVLSF